MTNNLQYALGGQVAEMLTGAWRKSPSADNLAADKLAAVASLLCSSGSGALAWWRVRKVSSEQCAVGSQTSEVTYKTDSAAHRPLPTAHSLLHDAYRQSRLAALVHEQEIKHVLSLLRAVDIEPVLVKGWAVARLYPDRALRPYGDIDLCVRPDQFEKAAAALKCLENVAGHYVDLHSGFGEVGRSSRQGQEVQSPKSKVQRPSDRVAVTDSSRGLSARRDTPGSGRQNISDPEGVKQRCDSDSNAASPSALRRLWTVDSGLATESWDELFARSQLVPLGDELIRVLSHEDHLRLLCQHLLRSGAWRPLWLCDVALLVETRATDFNWQRCLGSDPLYADWVAVTVGLAHHLLGLNIKDTPLAERAEHLPRWLVPAVLKQWGRARHAVPGLVQSPMSRNDRRRTTDDGGRFNSMFPVVGRPSSVSLSDFGHWTDLYRRWDNPIRATAAVHGRFNNWPRLPYRIAESVMRSRELPQHLRSSFKRNLKLKRRSGPQITPITQNRNFESA